MAAHILLNEILIAENDEINIKKLTEEVFCLDYRNMKILNSSRPYKLFSESRKNP